jgi:hypothetical protein
MQCSSEIKSSKRRCLKTAKKGSMFCPTHIRNKIPDFVEESSTPVSTPVSTPRLTRRPSQPLDVAAVVDHTQPVRTPSPPLPVGQPVVRQFEYPPLRAIRHLPEGEQFNLREMIITIENMYKRNIKTGYDLNILQKEDLINSNTRERHNLTLIDEDSKERIPCYNCSKFSDIEIENKYDSISIYDRKMGDKSTVGSIFLTCIVQNRNKKCDYITKVIDIIEKTPALVAMYYDGERSLYLNTQTVKNEIDIHMMAAALGVAPRIIDVFFSIIPLQETYQELNPDTNINEEKQRIIKVNSVRPSYLCRDGGTTDCNVLGRRFFIVMEKLDITVSSFLNMFEEDSKLKEEYKRQFTREIKSCLDHLNRNKIIHNDVHFSNCGFNISEKGKSYFQDLLGAINEKNYINIRRILESIDKQDKKRTFFKSIDPSSFKMIDFGKSLYFPIPRSKHEQGKFEMLKDIDYKIGATGKDG